MTKAVFAPPSNGTVTYVHKRNILVALLLLVFLASWLQHLIGSYVRCHGSISVEVGEAIPPFFSSVRETRLCTNMDGSAVSHAGYIGLQGDSDSAPRRSFFWLFDAQVHPNIAPTILTFGGGPGSSGTVGALWGQTHCVLGSNGTSPNPYAWSERFNVLVLDHPIGVGFSYGTRVNNSRAAAYDVYDFLQKFFLLFPHLGENNFVISSGSYGGIYIPHIARVIQERNEDVKLGIAPRWARSVKLESLMISAPISNVKAHYRWFLHPRCYMLGLYNSTTCAEMYQLLPECLDQLEFAFQNPVPSNRGRAMRTCLGLMNGDTHGRSQIDVRLKCSGPVSECYPIFSWAVDFFKTASVRKELGIPDGLQYISFSQDVFNDFVYKYGDTVQEADKLYYPLLEAGIRVLHFVGKQDASCPWPGVLATLRMIQGPFQQLFLDAPDVPWQSVPGSTVRAVGNGAGNFTYILIDQAGHFIVLDQPALIREVVEHWMDNRAFT